MCVLQQKVDLNRSFHSCVSGVSSLKPQTVSSVAVMVREIHPTSSAGKSQTSTQWVYKPARQHLHSSTNCFKDNLEDNTAKKTY